MKRRGRAARDLAAAYRELAGTTLLFKLRGRGAVARTTRRAMSVLPASAELAETRYDDLRRAVQALRRAESAWPLRVACLQRALVLQALLRRHGVAARVAVGSRFEERNLEAHAWVETGDYVLDEHGDPSGFHVFPAPDARGYPSEDDRS